MANTAFPGGELPGAKWETCEVYLDPATALVWNLCHGCPSAQTAALAEYPTRLADVSDLVQERLINWGYAICDAAMRAHVSTDEGPGAFPYPASAVG